MKIKEPAVWVRHFTVSGGPELNVLKRGLMQMLITDLMRTDQEARAAAASSSGRGSS